ncbi:MAG TPA: hypothetical protein VF545_10595 [Thermoleophilaceae bacterium]|jgi:hypothetical protein
MHASTYSRPEVKDYGTLLELTAQLDVHTVGVAANVVMAAMSSPMAPMQDPTVAGTLDTNQVGGARGGGGGGGGGGLLGLGSGGGGGGGKLPFTGFPVMLLASLGAAMASAGVALRALLRRQPRPEKP